MLVVETEPPTHFDEIVQLLAANGLRLVAQRVIPEYASERAAAGSQLVVCSGQLHTLIG